MSQYWNEQFQPFNNGLRTIGAGIAQLPAMRAIAANRAAMGQAYQARTQEATAATELINAQTGEIQTGDDRIDDAGNSTKAFMAAQQQFRDNPTPQNKAALKSATIDFSGAMAKFKNVKVSDLVTALGKTGALNDLISGNPNFQVDAGLQGNAAAIAGDQSKAALPANNQVTLPTGSTLVDRNTGQPVTDAGVTLNPGQTRFAPQIASQLPLTQTATGQPMQPKSSAVNNTIASAIAKTVLAQNSDASGTITNTPDAIGNQISTALKQFIPQSNSPTVQTAMSQLPDSGTPVAAQSAQSAPQIPIVNSQQDYDALPNGASYKDSNGNLAVKGRKPAAAQ